MRFRLGLTAVAAATALVTALPGTAFAATSQWRFSYRSPAILSELTGVAALSAHDAWAVGAVTPEGGAVGARPVVERWNGKSWSAVILPKRYRHDAELTAIAASSSTDVWVFGFSRNGTGQDPQTFALRWNGSWSTRGDWHTYNIVSSAVVFGTGNVWIFGNDATLHYNGSRWTTWKLPFTVIQASAINSNDIWAVGVGNTTGAVLARLHNGSWRLQPLPAPASAGAQTELFGVLARSDRDVWVVGGTESTSSSRPLALERVSGKWVRRNPSGRQILGTVVPDGAHGMWATFALGPYDGERLDHYSGGRWRTVILPNLKGKATSVTTLADVPRSTTVFGAGILLWGGLPETEGAILKYSR